MNTRFLWIFLIVLIVACGEAPQDQTPTAAPNSNSYATGKVNKPEDVGSALLVASAKSLPNCGETNEGQLVYAKDESQFYSCSNLAWDKIELHGSNGKDGIDGKNGANGVDGKNGVNGKDGKTLAPTDEFSWYHPVTNVKWFLGQSISSLYNPAQSPNLMTPNYICPAGSKLPTDAEYYDALSAGLWAKFGSKQPLLVNIGSVNYTAGILSYYSFRAGKPANGAIGTLFAANAYGTATALCVVTEQ